MILPTFLIGLSCILEFAFRHCYHHHSAAAISNENSIERLQFRRSRMSDSDTHRRCFAWKEQRRLASVLGVTTSYLFYII